VEEGGDRDMGPVLKRWTARVLAGFSPRRCCRRRNHSRSRGIVGLALDRRVGRGGSGLSSPGGMVLD